jgi:hypothetical protein
MTSISQGLKGGVSAGVLYGLMIGVLHLATLAGCSSAQIRAIAASPSLAGSGQSASSLFYSTDIVYYPMVLGLWAFVYGVIFGAAFAFAYRKLPGVSSNRKGLTIGAAMFFVDAFLGPGYLLEYSCGGGLLGGLLPYFTFALSVPAALVFGYLLGAFYDDFGRLEVEETEERRRRTKKRQEQEEAGHWSELFRRKEEKKTRENNKKVPNRKEEAKSA